MSGSDRHRSPAPRPVAFKTVIGTHLETILSSRVFKSADSLRELLRFTVHETLVGRGDDLKEYVLGATVLRKGDSFDPKADGIVRVQMRRLREHLERYYATEGRNDPLRIDIPKGTYRPTFRSAPPSGPITVPAVVEQRLVVGRQKELADLRAAFESTAAGHGNMFCLSGEPGIGKTTVAETFLRELAASERGCYVARGRCSERLAGSEAYLPVLEALEDLLRSGGEPVGALISVAAPDWYRQIPQRGADPSVDRIPGESRVASRERLKRELLALFDELTRRQPVVLFLDDLHWADASTIDTLAYVAARCRAQRILIIATYRPAELLATSHPFVRVKLELQGHGICRETAMPLLTRADVDRYLALQFPEHLFPPELSARIHDKTEGNPLFMADLVRFLRDRRVFVEREGRWTMVGQLPEIEHELPESVRSMIQKKIGELSDLDRRLMSAAAVQGQEFDSAVVASVLGVDPTDVEERLEALDRTYGFVRLTGDRTLPDNTFTLRYTFVHVLYQNALYSSLRPTLKVAWSAAVAETLLRYFGPQRSAIASELAILFEAARDYARTTDYFLMAAQQAAYISAYKEAVVLARRGLDALKLLPDTPERAHHELRLQTILGPALASTVGYGADEVQATYVRARELCQQVDETPQLFPVIWGLFHYWLARGKCQTAYELGEQLLALAEKDQDPALLLLAHGSLGDTTWISGHFEVALLHFEQVRAIYNHKQHQSLAAVYGGFDSGVACRHGLAENLWLLGYPEQALEKRHEAIAFAREIAHPYSLALSQIFAAMVHQHCRDAHGARQQAEAAIALATELEFGPWLMWAMALRGWALVEQGQAEEGLAQLREGIAGWTATGAVLLQPYFLALLAEAHARMAHVDEGLSTLVEALTIVERTGERHLEAELYRLKGELQIDPAKAEACFQQAISIARRQKAKSFELRAVTSLSRLFEKQGKHIAACQMLAEIYGWFTEGFDTADLKEAAALLERLGHSHSRETAPPIQR